MDKDKNLLGGQDETESSPWSHIKHLDAEHGDAHSDRAVPEVKLVEVREGVRIIRISFRPGDVMASHKAPGPIVLMGQTGAVAVQIGEEGDADYGEVTLAPGAALHIDTGKVHSLNATEQATVTLLLLTGA